MLLPFGQITMLGHLPVLCVCIDPEVALPVTISSPKIPTLCQPLSNCQTHVGHSENAATWACGVASM